MEVIKLIRPSRRVTKAAEAPRPRWRAHLRIVKFSTDDDDERLVTGAVLVPDKIDAHGDLVPAEVIRIAAHSFAGRLNSAPAGEGTTSTGVQHTDFSKVDQIRAVETYIAPQELMLGAESVPAGTWVVTFKVLDDETWSDIKNGEITGFSVSGEALVQRTEDGVRVAHAAEEAGVPYIVAARAYVEEKRAEAASSSEDDAAA